MTRISTFRLMNGPSIALTLGVSLAVLGGMAYAAQDRYTVKLGKLSFADFKGYEDWKDVAVSQTEKQLKVIVANDVMMKAYRQGLPADGKLFPEGSKIVKIEWSFKKNPVSPYFVQVPDKLAAVDVIEKDSRDSRTRTDGPTPISSTMLRLTRLRPKGQNPTAATRAIQRWRQKIIFSRNTPSDNRFPPPHE